MGVHGLTTYVEGNRSFLHDVKFRDRRLIVDGCSLFFRLYFNHGLDQQHGGDYDSFALLLTQFLSALEACSIQPYVVLDGGVDPSDKKFPTLRQRLQAKIKEAENISRGRNGSVLPILTRDVFIQLFCQRGIPLVQCPAEADWEIACLAHQWNCPVLTNDSDFYIFDLPGGYLPLRFFQWTNLSGKPSQRYIPARCYTTNNLCRWFGGLKRELLPLFAVLAGNDYGVPKEADTLLYFIEALSRGSGRGRGRAPSSRIEGLLVWLSSFSSVAEALEEVSRLMGGEGERGRRGQKEGLSTQLWAAMQEYNINGASSIAAWFSGGEAASRAKSSAQAQMPGWFSQAAAQGQLPPLVLDALVMQRVLLIPQVENSRLASSHFCSRAIRQAVYGMLLCRAQNTAAEQRSGAQQHVQGAQVQMKRGRGQGTRGGGGRGRPAVQQGGTTANKAANTQDCGATILVEEFDRQDLNLKKNQLEAHLPRSAVHLDGLSQAPVALRLRVFCDVLGVKETSLSAVPLHLQLSVAVTGFWLREAVPTPSPPLLQALVLGMVYGEISLNNQPGATPHQRTAPQQSWAAERNVLLALDKKRVRPGERRGLDIGAAHSFSQWQSCLWSALCLNQLLLKPLPEPHLSCLFSGTLVHGIVQSLKAGWTVESLLPEGSSSGGLYACMLGAVRDGSFTANPSSLGSERKKRTRGRRGRGRGGRGGRAVEEINNRFVHLMNEEECDDQWGEN